MSETPTDRVELTEDERSEIGLAVQEGDTSGLCVYVQSIVAARVQAYAEKFESLSDRAKKAATELGRKNDRLAAELAAANARCAELEADRAEYEPRLRELTASLIEARAETAAFRKSNEDWRDTAGEAIAEQEAAQREARSWESNYNTLKAENARLRSRITEGLVCQTCKTDFAERDALQETLDRVTALETVPYPGDPEYVVVKEADLRAALTPEGTE